MTEHADPRVKVALILTHAYDTQEVGAYFREHKQAADELMPLLADAWHAGWVAGCNDQQYGDENARPWTPNPYSPAVAEERP